MNCTDVPEGGQSAGGGKWKNSCELRVASEEKGWDSAVGFDGFCDRSWCEPTRGNVYPCRRMRRFSSRNGNENSVASDQLIRKSNLRPFDRFGNELEIESPVHAHDLDFVLSDFGHIN